MTMVKCMSCGMDIHYTDLTWSSEREEDYAGLCSECYISEIKRKVNLNELNKELEKKYEDKINKIINGDE